MARKQKGRGGARVGAGRPVGSKNKPRRRRIYKSIKRPPATIAGAPSLITLQQDFASNPRKKRFYLAMAKALPNITADEMDRIEPLLASAIGRHIIAEDDKVYS
jgi:hypothetical protein